MRNLTMLAPWLTLSFLLNFEIGLGSSVCPCSDASLCDPVKGKATKKEVVGFLIGDARFPFQKYDWNKLTTIVLAYVGTSVTNEIVCLAHKNNVKVQLLVGFKTKDLVRPGFRDTFIKETIEKVKKYNLDGVNMDYEDSVTPQARRALTTLMIQLRGDLTKANPRYGLSMDYVFCAFCSPGRTFDIHTIKRYIDFFILMDYDLQGFAYGSNMYTNESNTYKSLCWKVFNAPLPAIIRGARSFLSAGIPASQVVLAFPWYGNYYKCERLGRNNLCYVDCASVWAVRHQRIYSEAIKLLRSGPYTRMWNSQVSMPFFNYKTKDGSTYQMNYDDVQSLRLKYNVVKRYNLRGVGIWTVDYLDYWSKAKDIIKDVHQMWEIIPGEN